MSSRLLVSKAFKSSVNEFVHRAGEWIQHICLREVTMTTKLFDNAIVGNVLEDVIDFMGNILQTSTEYSIIGLGLDGTILLWNEGARRLYGYEPEEIIGKANMSILHIPEDVESGMPREIMESARKDGKWEGRVSRVRKNGERFTARMVITPASTPPHSISASC